MKTSVLQPDDFQVGMFITVKDLKRTTPEFNPEEMQNPFQAIVMMQGGGMSPSKNHLEALKGTVIRIDAVSLPFMIGTVFENAGRPGKVPGSQSVPLDVRELEFMKVNEEYVQVYLGKSSLITLLQNKKFSDTQNLKGHETITELLLKLAGQIEKEADDEASETAREEERKKNENT